MNFILFKMINSNGLLVKWGLFMPYIAQYNASAIWTQVNLSLLSTKGVNMRNFKVVSIIWSIIYLLMDMLDIKGQTSEIQMGCVRTFYVSTKVIITNAWTHFLVPKFRNQQIETMYYFQDHS